MTKQDLIDAISIHTGDTKKAASAFIDALSTVVAAELKLGGEVTLIGLGKFSASKREERVGRNPATGQAATIPAAVVPKFKVSSVLKQQLNG